MKIGKHETHPAADVFPMLDDSALEVLVADVKANGLLSPVVLYEDKVLDGRNRLTACIAAGVEPRFVTWAADTHGGDPFAYAWTVNVARRHLDAGQRAACWLKRQDGSARWEELRARVAEEADARRAEASAGNQSAAKKTVAGNVARDRMAPGEKAASWLLEHGPAPATSGGAHVTRAAQAEAAGVGERTLAAAQRVREADPVAFEKVAAGKTSLPKAEKKVKEEKRAAAKAKIPDDLPKKSDRYTVHHATVLGSMSEIDDDMIDWIITDPPYGPKYASAYDDLATFADAKLKPGGSLICMTGQTCLPDVMSSLGERLVYNWTLAYLTPGGQSAQLWGRKVNSFWKPLLWYVKGKYKGNWVGDVCKSDANDNDKTHHKWGQSESGMADIVERFTFPGQVVCDPFCGGGTTGVVALAKNRIFIGIDSDKDAVKTTLARLVEVCNA